MKDRFLRSNSSALLSSFCRAGFCGKTCPVRYEPTEAEISETFCGPWGNSGIAAHGEHLTLNTLDCPSGAKECFFWQIVEPVGNVPPEYCLSRKTIQRFATWADREAGADREIQQILKLWL